MEDVLRLFAEYKEAHRAGAGAEPESFLARACGGDREELAGLIDGYLSRSPRREFDAAAFRGSPGATVAESVQRSLAGQAGMWPTLLPRLRNRARVKRADLVAELSERLGAQGQRDKVGRYYHQMEQGLLPASGVSDTVLEELGKIIGTAKETLRRAGQMPAPHGRAVEGGAVFARTGRCAEPDADAMELAVPPSLEGDQDFDQVDRLFRGG